jgi:hypothetical protein
MYRSSWKLLPVGAVATARTGKALPPFRTQVEMSSPTMRSWLVFAIQDRLIGPASWVALLQLEPPLS